MKKIIIPFFSLMLVISLTITNSSFTEVNDSEDQTTYYWYRVTYVGSSGSISSPADIEFSGAPMTLAHADLNDGCSGSGRDCLRGFTAQLSTDPDDYPISTPGDQKTTKAP